MVINSVETVTVLFNFQVVDGRPCVYTVQRFLSHIPGFVKKMIAPGWMKEYKRYHNKLLAIATNVEPAPAAKGCSCSVM